MVNKEQLLAKRKESELKKQQKEIIVVQKHETLNKEDFINNLEAKELGEIRIATAAKKQAVKTSGKPGILSLIYSLKNGKRYQFSKDLYLKLGEPETVQFAFTDCYLLISELISEEATNYNVKLSQNRSVVYNSELVEEAIINYNLEYLEGCVSKTFYDCEYIMNPDTGKVVAKIKMKESTIENEEVNTDEI